MIIAAGLAPWEDRRIAGIAARRIGPRLRRRGVIMRRLRLRGIIVAAIRIITITVRRAAEDAFRI